jgi:hypothetical protein
MCAVEKAVTRVNFASTPYRLTNSLAQLLHKRRDLLSLSLCVSPSQCQTVLQLLSILFVDLRAHFAVFLVSQLYCCVTRDVSWCCSALLERFVEDAVGTGLLSQTDVLKSFKPVGYCVQSVVIEFREACQLDIGISARLQESVCSASLWGNRKLST